MYFCSHYGFMITSLTWVKFHWFIDHFLFNKGTHGTVPFRGNQKEKIVLLGWETLNCDLRTVFGFTQFTIIYKIFETNCSFHVKLRTTGKNQFLFFLKIFTCTNSMKFFCFLFFLVEHSGPLIGENTVCVTWGLSFFVFLCGQLGPTSGENAVGSEVFLIT